MKKVTRSFWADDVLRANKGLALLMFIILYTSFDTLIFGTLDMPIMRTIHDIGHIAVSLICLMILVVKNRPMTKLMLLIAWILLTCVVNGDFGGGNYLLIIVFIISFCIASTIPIKKFLEVYEHLFFYLVVINLILYLIYNISPALFSFLPSADSIVGGNYRIAFLTVFPEGDYVHLRNMSFFREPGVYMIYLNLAIIINLFSYENPNKRNLVVYIIAMITTLSTAGYVILLLILFIYFGLQKSRLGVFVIAIISIVFVFSYNYISELDIFLNTIGKFSSQSDKHISAEARYASTTAPLYIMYNYPVFGSGLELFTQEFEQYTMRVYKIMFTRSGTATNTLLNLGAIYGVVMLLQMFYYLTKFVKKMQLTRNTVITVFLFVAIFLMLSNEEVYYTVFIMTLIMYGATNQKYLNTNISHKHIK